MIADTIRVDAATRPDALDLARRLAAHHTYLVQLGNSRWHVCVSSDDPEGELAAVRAVAAVWAVERDVESVVHLRGREYAVRG